PATPHPSPLPLHDALPISCRLVGIASVAGIRGLPGSEAYSASKAAVISYCEALRVELRASGIKVVTIAPGYVDTPMTRVNTYPIDRKSTRLNFSHVKISYA